MARDGTVRLVCPDCGSEFEADRMGGCPRCGSILECAYPGHLQAPASSHGGSLARYHDRLPVQGPLCSLGEGDTPLVRAARLGDAVGMEALYLKNEAINPTGSFKDRGSAIAVTLAQEHGYRGLLTASTGNAAASLAAYCASQGLDCVVLFSAGSPLGKLRQALAFGARCVQVEGLFEGKPEAFASVLTAVSEALKLYLGFFWAPVNPYLIEGMKTIAYETVEQLGGRAPDVVVGPAGGGDGLVGQWRGYRELYHAGLIERLPRLIGVQSSGAAPLVRAFERGKERVGHIAEAHTVASGLQVTFSGDHALRAIRESGGAAVAVEDKGILEAQRKLARMEGAWVEPSAAVGVAALPALLGAGLIEPQDRVVCVLTGAGFKDHDHDAVSEGDAAAVGPAVRLDAELIEGRISDT